MNALAEHTKAIGSLLTLRNPLFRKGALIHLAFLMIAFAVVPVSGMILPALVGLIGGFLFVSNQRFAVIFLYLILFPTNGMVSRSEFLLGIVGPQQVMGLLSLIVLFKTKTRVRLNNVQQVAKNLLFVLMAYMIYTSFKNAFFDLHSMSFSSAITRTINVFTLYGPLVLLIQKSGEKRISDWLTVGIFFSALNLLLFCFISPILPDLGFYSLGAEGAGLKSLEVSDRYLGIIGDGDSNTAGAVFTIIFGFFLAKARAIRSSFMIKVLMVLSLVGIALSGSRTAFIAMSGLIFLFYLSRGNSKIKTQSIVVGALFIIVTLPLWETVIARMGEADSQLNTHGTSNRIGKWIFYFNHFAEMPITLLIGSPKTIFLGFDHSFHQAHNVFITMVYNSGFAFLALLFYYMGKLVFIILNRGIMHPVTFILFPVFAIMMTVSDMGAVTFFIMTLTICTPALSMVDSWRNPEDEEPSPEPNLSRHESS